MQITLGNTEQMAVLAWLEEAVAVQSSTTELLQETANLVREKLPIYNWVGFYMLDPDDKSMLELGPYSGAPTPHTRIPVTEGICGAAVAQGETVVVDDVSADPRYLACSIETKSEIVVPIRANGAIIGEIDIDSHTASAFGLEDRAFVERCAEILGDHFASASVSK